MNFVPISTCMSPSTLAAAHPTLPSAAQPNSQNLWKRLGATTYACEREPIANEREIGNRVAGVICPQRTAVQVKIMTGTSFGDAYIHANRISFPQPSINNAEKELVNGPAKVAIAAQSPQQLSLCEKFLVQGLDSGQGLFQFVSRKAHRTPDHSVQKTILGQLRGQWEGRSENAGPLVLAGRYEVTALKELSSDKHQCRYALTAVDVLDRTKTRTVVLTQAGLQFTDKLLRSAQIKAADDLMHAHLAQCGPASTDVASGQPESQTEPMVISHAGIGRNATLIAYREVLTRFDVTPTDHALDIALEEVIYQGRESRGPRFMHSQAQLDELKKALKEEFARRSCHALSPRPAVHNNASLLRSLTPPASAQAPLPTPSNIDASIREIMQGTIDRLERDKPLSDDPLRYPPMWNAIKGGLPGGYLSDQQNWMAAEYLYDRLRQQNPGIKEVKLMSIGSGNGRSEAYLAAHLKHKGIAVKELLAVDTDYPNKAKPDFLQTLQENELIQRGEWFSSAGDCLTRCKELRFKPDAIIAIHWAVYFSAARSDVALPITHQRALDMYNLYGIATDSTPFVRFITNYLHSAKPPSLSINDDSVFMHKHSFLRDQIMTIQRFLSGLMQGLPGGVKNQMRHGS